MVTATWNGAIIAESDDTVVVEGNHYFPLEAVASEYLRKSDTTSRCPWKGQASYYSLEVDGNTNVDAAWYYPSPSEAAKSITGRVAFWRGVKVEEKPS
jgi:uncharacterized protein (DUF427 family)